VIKQPKVHHALAEAKSHLHNVTNESKTTLVDLPDKLARQTLENLYDAMPGRLTYKGTKEARKNFYKVILLIVKKYTSFQHYTKPKNDYERLSIIAIIASPLVIFERSVVDELVLAFFALKLVYNIKTTKSSSLIPIKKKQIEILFLLFLIINSLISLVSYYPLNDLRGYNLSTIRFLVIYCSFLIIISLKDKETTINKKLISFYFLLSLSALSLYLVILRFMGIDWGLMQAKLYAGSKYAVFDVIIGLLIILKFTPKQYYFSFRNIFLYYFSLSIFTAYLMNSRLLFGALILVSIFLILTLEKWFQKIIICLFCILSILTQDVFTAKESSEYKPETKNYKLFDTSKLKNVFDSMNFLIAPRETDSGIKKEIDCSANLILNSERKFNSLFGYGTSSHRSLLYSCYGSSILTPGAPVRPVGMSAFLIDYGIFGVLFLFCIVLIRVWKSIRIHKSYEFIIIFCFTSTSLFLVNILDNSLFWLIILLGFPDEIKNTQTKGLQ
jgi:hypothetical protein